jgi:hypothetical protein
MKFYVIIEQKSNEESGSQFVAIYRNITIWLLLFSFIDFSS